MHANLYVVITYFIINMLFSILCYYLTNKELNALKNKLSKYSSNIENYAANENDVIENVSEKVKHLESYITDLERKIITVKTDIEILKNKKTSVVKKTNKKL